MKRQLKLGSKTIEYYFRRSKTKNLRLVINSRGQLIATKPWYASFRDLENFLQQKSDWIIEHLNKASGDNKSDYLIKKEEARKIIDQRLKYYSLIIGVNYNRLSIRNSISRWGSCSNAGNLSFSYKVAFLPEALRDYIVIHELCHRRHFHHGERFWQEVAKYCPKHQELRRQLKLYENHKIPQSDN